MYSSVVLNLLMLLCNYHHYTFPELFSSCKTKNSVLIKKWLSGTSLVAQWLRICLPMQGTQVQSLDREDPTCCGATKPMHHKHWAWALEPVRHNYWAHVLQLLKPMRGEPMICNKRSHCNKKPVHHNEE